MASLTGERDDAVRRNADLRRRHAHFQHEIKRKEQDFERLQVRPQLPGFNHKLACNQELALIFSFSLHASHTVLLPITQANPLHQSCMTSYPALWMPSGVW